ncbi:MAG: hypothetical protein MPN21_25780 [Thermoanaerobaculia bacterium]|nr:hypothetical protein [Thermoanaerobaculia bacterium]
MRKRRESILLLCLVLVFPVVGPGAHASDSSEAAAPTVVMVCEHGAVKSVIAAALFDREAKDRGLDIQAVSRGIAPYERIPDKIIEALENDGFDVSEFVPQKLSKQDVAESKRIVAIATDLARATDGAAHKLEQWDDVPPASVDYEASKAALLSHVESLLAELAADSSGRTQE